jgi:hypothetical protein
VSGLLSRLALAVVPALVALACVITASGFLIGALYLYLLAMPVPPELASLIVGVVLMALAALVIVAARLVASRGQPRIGGAVGGGTRANGLGSIAGQLGTSAGREAAAAAEAHPYYTFCAAFLAGLTLGGSPALRNFVEMALRAAETGDRARSR